MHAVFVCVCLWSVQFMCLDGCLCVGGTELIAAIGLSFTTCSPQIRSLQSECEDYKTEIDLLKRRIEQLRKRRDYATDS